MKKFTLRFFVLITTFLLGISAVAIWFFSNQSQSGNLNAPPADFAVVENISKSQELSLASKINEEYAIYSAVLSADTYNNKMIVIRSKTFSSGWAKPENFTNLLSDSEDVIADYQRKNEAEHFLQNNFDVSGKVILISEKENEKIFSKDGNVWDKFYKKYPDANGIITFSRIGINAEQTEALVHVSIGCGWLCGEGNFIHLQKDNGKWVIKREIGLWVS